MPKHMYSLLAATLAFLAFGNSTAASATIITVTYDGTGTGIDERYAFFNMDWRPRETSIDGQFSFDLSALAPSGSGLSANISGFDNQNPIAPGLTALDNISALLEGDTLTLTAEDSFSLDEFSEDQNVTLNLQFLRPYVGGSFMTFVDSTPIVSGSYSAFEDIQAPLDLPYESTGRVDVGIGASDSAPAPSAWYNLNITDILAPPLPEPATWAMMLLGFGAIGIGVRRRSGIIAI